MAALLHGADQVYYSNLALPGRLDERLSLVLTTLRMHGVHHSVVKAERDSNWSSGIIWWDHLHGTFRATPLPRAITIGVDDPDAAADVRFNAALRAPFIRNPTGDAHQPAHV